MVLGARLTEVFLSWTDALVFALAVKTVGENHLPIERDVVFFRQFD